MTVACVESVRTVDRGNSSVLYGVAATVIIAGKCRHFVVAEIFVSYRLYRLAVKIYIAGLTEILTYEARALIVYYVFRHPKKIRGRRYLVRLILCSPTRYAPTCRRNEVIAVPCLLFRIFTCIVKIYHKLAGSHIIHSSRRSVILNCYLVSAVVKIKHGYQSGTESVIHRLRIDQHLRNRVRYTVRHRIRSGNEHLIRGNMARQKDFDIGML